MESMEPTRQTGRSAGALAELAMRQTNAAGYALYEVEEESGRFLLISASGVYGAELRHMRDLPKLDTGADGAQFALDLAVRAAARLRA